MEMTNMKAYDRVASSGDSLDVDLNYDVIRRLQKKSCKRFVPRRLNKSKCKCGYLLSKHNATEEAVEPLGKHGVNELGTGAGATGHNTENAKPDNAEPWNMKDVETDGITDAFGHINFVGIGQQTAEYVRLADDTPSDLIYDVLTQHWQLEQPQFIISIIGGGKSFDMSTWRGRWKRIVNDGFVKVAKQVTMWVVTNGTHTGVIKAVGQAVKEGQTHNWTGTMKRYNQISCIGIASWGYIDHEGLVNKSRESKYVANYTAENLVITNKIVSLNPDHTNFLLVDDGTKGFYRGKEKGEHELRARFEVYMRNEKGVPCVQLIVGVEKMGYMDQMLRTLKEGIPAVIAVNTGVGANILADAYKRYTDVYARERENGYSDTIEKMEAEISDHLKEELQIAYPYMIEDQELLTEILDNLKKCCSRDNIHFISLFDFNERDDLDVAILTTLFRVRGQEVMSPIEKLQYAYKWQRADIAKSIIDYEYSKPLSKRQAKEAVRIQDITLVDLFINALRDDKVEFVKMLLESGIYLRQHLNILHLIYLYNQTGENEVLHQQLRLIANRTSFEDVISDDIHPEQCMDLVLLQHVSQLFKKLVGYHKQEDYSKRVTMETIDVISRALEADFFHNDMFKDISEKDRHLVEQLKTPVQELFLWAIIMGRQDIGKLLWGEMNNGISSALAASTMLKKFSGYFPLAVSEKRAEYETNSQEFAELAGALLDECTDVERPLANKVITRPVSRWKAEDAMALAANGDISSFLANTGCQNVLTGIWTEDLLSSTFRMLLSVFFPLLIFTPFIRFGNPSRNLFKKLIKFYNLAVVKFTMYTISQIIFILLFSYFILFDFDALNDDASITVIELILMVWTGTLMLEEIRQVFVERMKWFKSLWNLVDFGGMLLVVTAFSIRIASYNAYIPHNKDFYQNAYDISRLFYAMSCLLWYCRVCNVFLTSSYFGPLLIMILRMLVEVVFFLIILAVFLVGYGVASQALMYTHREPFLYVIKHVIYHPFWNLLGELNLEEVEGDPYCKEGS
ncbi:unnamed protein product, partial [Owenia fusiformis]